MAILINCGIVAVESDIIALKLNREVDTGFWFCLAPVVGADVSRTIIRTNCNNRSDCFSIGL